MIYTKTVIPAFYAESTRGNPEATLSPSDTHIKPDETEWTPYCSKELVDVGVVGDTVSGAMRKHFNGFSVTPDRYLVQNDRTAVFCLCASHFISGGGGSLHHLCILCPYTNV